MITGQNNYIKKKFIAKQIQEFTICDSIDPVREVFQLIKFSKEYTHEEITHGGPETYSLDAHKVKFA